MSHERFLRLSTAAGPLGRVDAPSGGLRVEYFSVQVPDTVVDLRVEYVLGDASAGAESLHLAS